MAKNAWSSWNGGLNFPGAGSYTYNPNSTGGLAYSGPGAVSNYGFGFQPNSMTPITAATSNANTSGLTPYQNGFAAAMSQLSLAPTAPAVSPSSLPGSGLTGSLMKGWGSMTGTTPAWKGFSADTEGAIAALADVGMSAWKNYTLGQELDEIKRQNQVKEKQADIELGMKYDAFLPEFQLAQGKARAVGDWVASQGGDATKFTDMANLATPTRPKLI